MTLVGLSPRASVIGADHSKVWSGQRMWLRGGVLALLLAIGCGPGALPRPASTPVLAADYVEVPFTPRPPPVEIVPPRPAASGDLVWADGGWEWSGERYRWDAGGWFVVPAGVKRARWVLVRRQVDGQLFFAPSSWRDAAGKAVNGLRPIARAQTRLGGSASGLDDTGGGGAASAPTESPPPTPRESGPSAPPAPPVDE
ncbi:MAG: hypothetical protein JWP97_1236 [Labilithrix sp.]|nr:hypothetical protein [Labilithrix sp.]